MGLSNCNNKLSEPVPQQSIPFSEALNSPEKVKAAVIGVYGLMGGPTLYGGDLQLSGDLLGGGYEMRWRGTFASYREVIGKNMVAANGIATATWIDAYEAINACNNILENIDVITKTADKNTAKGEALMWRGVCYFELIRLYAQPWDNATSNTGLGVPLMLKANDFTRPTRATIAAVYAQILQDLTTAETLLPVDNGTYASKSVAQAFLARVYMQKSDYTNALAKANEVIGSPKYKLNATVTQVFDINNTLEAIFEIQQNLTNNAGSTNAGLATFHANLPGVGRGDIQIRNDHLDLYDAADDRLISLFYESPEGSNRPGRMTSGKWKDPFKNYNIIRLAEMILTRAECNQRLGSSVGATPLNDINQIRNRAKLPNLTSVSLNNILLERDLELAFEGHKIHDLKRVKASTFNIANPDDIEFTFDSPKTVFPIPRRELDANPNLVQNPGY